MTGVLHIVKNTLRCMRRTIFRDRSHEAVGLTIERVAKEVATEARAVKQDISSIKQEAKTEGHGDVLAALLHSMRKAQFREIVKNNPNLD